MVNLIIRLFDFIEARHLINGLDIIVGMFSAAVAMLIGLAWIIMKVVL